jgi:lambda family phage tail tape measure protein
MATIDNYKIKITVDGQEKVVDLMDSVDELQSTITTAAAAGIAAFTALATSAVRMADDMVDLSKATGFTVGEIYKLSTALEASGGKFDDSGKFIQSFSRLLGQVEQGSKEAIDSLTQLGLTRNEIENLSDEELYKAAINGLANMEDGFEKTRIATELFGKSAASVDFKQLAEGLKGTVDPEVERNLLLAADAVQSLETSFRNLQIAAIGAIAPVLQGIKDLNFTAEDAKTAIQVLGSLVAAAFAAGTVVQIAKIVKLVKDLGGAMRAAGAASAFLVGLSGVGLIAVAASAAAATAAYVALGKAMEGAATEKANLETPGTPATPGAITPARTIGVTPEEKALASLKEQTRQLRIKNDEANKYQRLINTTIGLSQQEANLIKTMADLERQAANEKLDIQKQIDAELAKGSESNAAIVSELQKQLIEVDKQLIAQKQLKNEELNRLFLQEQLTKSIEKNANLELFNLQARADAQKSLLMLQAANGEITEKQAQVGTQLAEAQNRFEQERIKLAKQRALLSKNATAQEIADLDDLDRMNQTRYANELRNIADVQAAETLKNQNIFKGIGDAMENLSKQFTPYQMAQDAVLAGWNKIGGAIDTFIETGKFKFKDFAASVIADLTKIIAKALILQAIKSIFGNFGIPGLAEGGPAKAGQPYMVGEKGPELFVPKSAGTVIPNNKLNGSTATLGTDRMVNAPITNNYNTYNINAVDAKSVAQLFAENRKVLLGTVKMAERELPYMA